MVSPSVGTLIWLSFRPMLRLVLCASTGFIITKADLMPLVAARGAAQIALNICLPSLFFSKIVPAFTPQNIGNLGPLVLVCLLYQVIGLLTCLMILPFFWVPHRFRWGFIVAGAWGNYGDLPTAVIMSVTASAPFRGSDDQDLAVAYIAPFVLIFLITLFPMGGHHLIARDFKGAEKDTRRSFLEKSSESAVALIQLLHAAIASPRKWCHGLVGRPKEDIEAPSSRQDTHLSPTECEEQDSSQKMPLTSQPERSKSPSVKPSSQPVTFSRTDSLKALPETGLPSCITSAAPTITVSVENTHLASTGYAMSSSVSKAKSPSQRLSCFYTLRGKSIVFIRTLLTVPTMTVVLAMVISVIPPVKGLFVSLPSSPKAPDGQPPLAFIMDTTTFLGGASIPLGLICLGSAIARLKLPEGDWRKMPVGAILALAVGRMVVQPVLGVLIVQRLTDVGLISVEDKVLRFVCIFFSCVPTATTQVFLTQVYSGTGSADHVSTFLIPQYLLMFISSTALTAYSLRLLFE